MYEESTVKTDNSLVELVRLLQSIDTENPEAEQNETTMVNDLGERVKY